MTREILNLKKKNSIFLILNFYFKNNSAIYYNESLRGIITTGDFGYH